MGFVGFPCWLSQNQIKIKLVNSFPPKTNWYLIIVVTFWPLLILYEMSGKSTSPNEPTITISEWNLITYNVTYSSCPIQHQSNINPTSMNMKEGRTKRAINNDDIVFTTLYSLHRIHYIVYDDIVYDIRWFKLMKASPPYPRLPYPQNMQ